MIFDLKNGNITLIVQTDKWVIIIASLINYKIPVNSFILLINVASAWFSMVANKLQCKPISPH